MDTEPSEQQVAAVIADTVTQNPPEPADAAMVSASISHLTRVCEGDDSAVQALVVSLGRMHYSTMQHLAARALRAEAGGVS